MESLDSRRAIAKHHRMLQPLRSSSLIAVFLLLAACGGIVLVEQEGSGGAGGAPSTSSSSGPTTSVSSSVSTGTGTDFCDGTGDCGFAFSPSPDCLSCDSSGCIGCALAGACADELAACQSEPQCVSFVICVEACSDQQCFDECSSQTPQGVELYSPVRFCVICDQCPSDCDGPGLGCP